MIEKIEDSGMFWNSHSIEMVSWAANGTAWTDGTENFTMIAGNIKTQTVWKEPMKKHTE